MPHPTNVAAQLPPTFSMDHEAHDALVRAASACYILQLFGLGRTADAIGRLREMEREMEREARGRQPRTPARQVH